MTDEKSKEFTGLYLTLDLCILVLTLYSLAVIVEHFMIPSLQGISKKYKLSQQATGYILAFGASIPEFTTNLVSATSEKGNVNIGVGTISGSGSFDFTICFGIASLFTVGQGLNLNRILYYRDAFIYLFTLSILTFFLKDNAIEFYEALILVLFCPIYIYISTIQTTEEEEKSEIKLLFNSDNALVDISTETVNRPLAHEISKLNVSIIDESEVKHSPHDFNTTIQSQKQILNQTQMVNVQHSNIVINETQEKEEEEEKETKYNNYLDELNEENEENMLLITEENKVTSVPKTQKGFFGYINYALDTSSSWVVYLYSFIIPNPEERSALCFLFIMFLTYLHTRLTIFLIENLSSLVKLTASFLGMTLLSWGGNVGDTINASVATKIQAADLLTTSILGSQVINLQLCLGLPWMISIVRNYYEKGEPLVLNFGHRNPLKFLLPLFIVVLVSIFIMTVFQTNLNKKSGICLILIYIIYLAYEFDHNMQ